MPLRAQRASKIAAVARFHGYAHIESLPFPPLHNAEAVWFTKVVCTLCFCHSQSIEIFSSDYFRKNLSPVIASGVIRHLSYNYKNPRLAFDFFQFTGLRLNLLHSFGTCNWLLRSLCEMGHQDSAKLVLEYMKTNGHLLDSSTLELLVSSFANAGHFEMAKELLIAQSQSTNDNVGVINSFVCNNFLSLLVTRNRVDEAVSFFRNYILRSNQFCIDTCTFNIIIRGLCRVGEVDRAFEFFNGMGNFGCLHDTFTYNTLINGCFRVGNVDRARKLLREIQSQNGSSPDIVTYTSVISGYCKLGKMEEASNIFDEMIAGGIRPNLVTFNVIIDGFGRTGDMVSAFNMYERMLSVNCFPDVVTFTSLAHGHCRIGQVDQGLKLLEEMNARNLSPNAYTFSILINALCKENRLNEARDLLRLLRWKGNINRKPFIYNPVIDGFCKAGNVDEANAIVTEMMEVKCHPDKLTFTILILGHCMKGRMSEAISIFETMLAAACAPDSITVNSLMSCLLKAGMAKEAFRIKKIASKDFDLGICPSRRNGRFRTNMDVPVAV